MVSSSGPRDNSEPPSLVTRTKLSVRIADEVVGRARPGVGPVKGGRDACRDPPAIVGPGKGKPI